jgi:hypothetical protein
MCCRRAAEQFAHCRGCCSSPLGGVVIQVVDIHPVLRGEEMPRLAFGDRRSSEAGVDVTSRLSVRRNYDVYYGYHVDGARAERQRDEQNPSYKLMRHSAGMCLSCAGRLRSSGLGNRESVRTAARYGTYLTILGKCPTVFANWAILSHRELAQLGGMQPHPHDTP